MYQREENPAGRVCFSCWSCVKNSLSLGSSYTEIRSCVCIRFKSPTIFDILEVSVYRTERNARECVEANEVGMYLPSRFVAISLSPLLCRAFGFGSLFSGRFFSWFYKRWLICRTARPLIGVRVVLSVGSVDSVRYRVSRRMMCVWVSLTWRHESNTPFW